VNTHFVHRFVIVACLAVAIGGCTKLKAGDHVRRGNTYFDEKKFPEAVIEFRAALQGNPKLGDVRLKLGEAYLRVNNPRGALGEYVRASDLLPKNVDAQLKAGGLLLLAGQFEDAKARAERALALDSKNVDAQVLKGNALAGLKDFDAAMAEYQDAIAADPSQNAATSNLGMLQLAKGQKAEAEKTFTAAVEASPKSVPARLALANFYWSTGRPELAEGALKGALEIDDKEVTANRALGLFYISTNRVPEAEKYFIALARVANTDDTVLTLADYYVAAKRPEEARKVLNERAAHDSAFAQASVRLASLDASEGHRADALNRLHDVLQKHPTNSSALLLSARLYLMDGKRAEAKKAAGAVIANEPRSISAADAWFLTGGIETINGRLDEAIKAFEQVLTLQPRPLAANIALAKLYLGRRDAGKAESYAQQALVIRPGDPESTGILVRTDLLKGDVPKASADLAPLQKTLPNSVGVAKLKALIQIASKQPDAARASYARVLQVNPNDLDALEALLAIDVAGGHAKDAAARMDARLKEAQPSVGLLVLAASAHGAAGSADKAESLLQRAIEVDPDRLEAYAMLGQMYTQQHRLEEAKTRFGDILARNPKSVSAATMIAMLLEMQGRTPDAEKQYEKVLAIDARAAVASNNLAWIYVASGRKLDEALQLAQAAQQLLPDEPNINDTLGWIYYRKNMAPQAVRYLETAAQKLPNGPVQQYHLGMAYVQLGDFAKARAALQRAFSLKPDFEGAAEARKALTMIG